MKTLTIIALLCSSICYGQCKYKINEKDPFTKTQKIRLKDKTIAYGEMLQSLTATMKLIKGYKFLYLKYSMDLGCVGSDSYTILLFSNDSTITLKHIGEIDCGETPWLILRIDEYEDIIKGWELSAIRVSYKNYADVEIYKKQKTYLSDAMNCLQ